MAEISINEIDYSWVDKTEDKRLLNKALKILKEDGGYFVELEKYIEDKLAKVDKKFKMMSDAKKETLTKDDLLKYKGDIVNWEHEMTKMEKVIAGQQEKEIDKLAKKKRAENDKFKGNELMKTKEYEEALRLYNRSVQADSEEPTTYCNRALANIRLSQFEAAVKDCDKALELKPDYAKAFYRRALAYSAVNKFKEAFYDLVFILKDSPSSREIQSEIDTLKEKWQEYIGRGEWTKIDWKVDESIHLAKESKQFKKTLDFLDENKDEPVKKRFKKINIIEEEVEVEPKLQKKTEEDGVPPELAAKFDKFMKAGAEVKKELQSALHNGNLKYAQELGVNSLKDCQNFISMFHLGSPQHSELENVIGELNTLLGDVQKRIERKEEEKKEEEKVENQFYKTKILNEEVREKATKIAEKSMNFNDFPKTTLGFEKAYNTMKKKPHLFFNYLLHLGGETISKIYKNSEISYPLLIDIIKTLRANINQDSLATISDLVLSIPKTKNFALVKKFFKKTDKEEVKKLLDELQVRGELNGEQVDTLYF